MKFTSVYPFGEKTFFFFVLHSFIKAVVSAHTGKFRWLFPKNIHCGLQTERYESTYLGKVQILRDVAYNFEKDYNLLPLSEVEAYVNQNKHLPEVPSAKEMEENGLNLKEMNLLLLKKVEELTLHLIEQNKKIESQDNEIGSQRTLLQDLLLKVKKCEK